MLLKDYIEKNKIDKREFAKELGVTYYHLQNVIAGTRHFSTKAAAKIEEITFGAVTRMEVLYPEDFQEVEKFGVQYLFLKTPLKQNKNKE